jgi:hypothetical protein
MACTLLNSDVTTEVVMLCLLRCKCHNVRNGNSSSILKFVSLQFSGHVEDNNGRTSIKRGCTKMLKVLKHMSFISSDTSLYNLEKSHCVRLSRQSVFSAFTILKGG